MKSISFPFVIVLLIPDLVISLSALEKTKIKDLPEKYRQWLEEEVTYIITPVEKDIFLELKTDRERDLFIDAFWKQRDPTPGTEENEFRREHYRRVQYANRMFRSAGKPGWKTDRGKAYIILGEPKDIRTFQGSDSYYPAELWFYQGLSFQDLPQAFHLLFFQRNRGGDFVLYDPATDGPWNLIANFKGNIGNYQEAYEVLSDIEPELANASLSLIPGESLLNVPSLASSMLLRTLDTAAQRNIKDLYARKFLEYKDTVEVEYSTNFIESDWQVFVLRHESGISFVHFSIEPAMVNMASYERTVSTNLELNGIVTDEKGEVIFQFEKVIPLRFPEDQFQKMRQRPLSITETFPLLPGKYKLSVLLKNTVSKEFTSFEQELLILSSASAPTVGPLLLAFNSAKPTPPPAGPRPFLLGDLLFYAQPKKTFLRQDKLHVFFQLDNLSAQDKERDTLKFAFFKDGREVFSQTHPLVRYGGGPNILEIFSLQDFSPGYYDISVSLLDAEGKEISSRKEAFEISSLSYLPRPWVYAKSLVDAGMSEVYFILGRQMMNRGDCREALGWLEKARQLEPNHPGILLSLARSYFLLQRPNDCLRILSSFPDKENKTFEFLELMGESHKILGNYREAIRYFEQALFSYGLNINVLNMLGECHLQLGNKKEAIAMWEKSLEIKPGQEEIQKKLAALKNLD